MESTVPPTEIPSAQTQSPAAPTKGDRYESIAFNFCKAATIILLAGPFALPVASGAATIFYLLAHRNGRIETRCILGPPLRVAIFWGIICVVSLFLKVRALIGVG